jgi:hypothetical protein
MKALIYDYETLSNKPTEAPVLTMALYRFDSERFIDNPYTLDEIVRDAKFFKFNAREQIEKFDRKPNKDTIKWWMNKPKPVQDSQFKPLATDISITNLVDIFFDNYVKDDLVFTRGNTFDPVITEAVLSVIDKDFTAHPFWVIRDTRSYIEGMAYGNNINNSFMPDGVGDITDQLHDPRVDIALDVLRIQALAKALS